MNYVHLKRGVQTVLKQPAPPATQTKGFVDQRPEFAAQRKLIDGIQNCSGVAQCSLKIKEKVYDIEKGKYRVNGKEVENYQSVIAEIKKDVEETTREKTETGEKKYKWDDNWNNIVADFVERKEIVSFSNIGEFINKIEATVEDNAKLDRLLENLSTVKMIRPLAEITQEESVLEKERQEVDKSMKKTQVKIKNIEDELIKMQNPIASSSSGGDVSKQQESVKGTCSETMGQISKERTAEKEECNKYLNSLEPKYQTLNENLLNLVNEKEVRKNITECWKILKKYPLQKEKRRQLFNVEKKLAVKSPEMNDRLLLPTRQEMGTTMCWFLSVFEGLRRAKLVYPIIERLIDDPESESIFSDFSGLQDWQLLLKHKFMEHNGISKLTSQILRPSKNKNGVGDKEIMTAFFNGIDPKFPGVLAGYRYFLEEDTPLRFNIHAKDLDTALKSLPKKGGIQIDGVTQKISFYTVDKPGHAMFYLGRSPYGGGKDVKGEKTKEEKVVTQKIEEMEAELLLINKGLSMKIYDPLKDKKMRRDKIIAEKKELKERAVNKLTKELMEIQKIPITGYEVHVYNQSFQAEEIYRLGQIERIQKHTFTP